MNLEIELILLCAKCGNYLDAAKFDALYSSLKAALYIVPCEKCEKRDESNDNKM